MKAAFFPRFAHFEGINLDDMKICEYNEVLNSGFLNLAREEAKRMARKSERSLVFLFICFAFVCLLLGGGSRLIGVQAEEEAMPEQAASLMRAAFVSAPAPQAETGTAHQREQVAQRHAQAPAPENRILNILAQCDANGNVLESLSYLRTVYQAFALGDGFV